MNRSGSEKRNPAGYPPDGVNIKFKIMYAIVEIAGQQFKVEKDKKLFVHQLDAKEGDAVDFEKVLYRVSKLFDIDAQQILRSGKQPMMVKARSLVCYWAVKELEMSGANVSQKLKITNSTVSRSVARGEKIASEMKLKLMEL